jgi:hypothetical protein
MCIARISTFLKLIQMTIQYNEQDSASFSLGMPLYVQALAGLLNILLKTVDNHVKSLAAESTWYNV